MLRQLFRPSNFTKFYQSLRHEGPRAAFGKAAYYGRIIVGGAGRSALNVFGGKREMSQDHMYLAQMWQTLARNEGFHISKPPALLSKRRKIALIADMYLPQCRKYRVEQLAEFWRARDVEVEYAHYDDVPRASHIMADATHLFEYRLQNMPTCGMYRYEARRLKLPVLFDIDDPLFSVSAYETYANMEAVEPALKRHFLSEAPKYLEMMNGADAITVSTPGMVEHARQYTRRPVWMRRNFADETTLRDGARVMQARPEAGDGLFRVAFASGSRGHEVDFALIQEQLAAFLDGAQNRRLLIIGHFDKTLLPEALRDRIEMHAFSGYDAYLERLARADCAVMPLTDDIFNRCKSAVRMIDASAVGVPSIVGTVGDLANVVRDGETGFVAESPADWGRALDDLARDVSAARAMGNAARADLEARWSGADATHIVSPELLEWVKG